MSDTQVLLSKIAALRQRLDAQRRPRGAGLPSPSAKGATPLDVLEDKVAAGARQQALLEVSLRRLPDALSSEPVALPARLTARAARVLRRSQEILAQLHALAEEPRLDDEAAPFALLFREAAVMTDTAVRMVQAFPETPSVQLRLCGGLEVILATAAERLALVRAGLQQLEREEKYLSTLSDLLTALASGRTVDLTAWTALAEHIVSAAHEAEPFRFLYRPPDNPVRFVAAHSLTVARVAARVSRQEQAWRNRPVDPVLAALVHDVGMLSVPRVILCQPGPLEDPKRRAVEIHALAGAELLARALPQATFLAEAAAYHHERLDGTGYPSGLRDLQIAPLVRLLAVCDVYAALGAERPHRPALDTRTALTDTLLLAQQGALDPGQAELLLKLSFYPTGTLVELADGAQGLVVATHEGRQDVQAPARPVVALLRDARGNPLPALEHVDLAVCAGRSIVRSLPAPERSRVLGRVYPALV